MRAWGATMIVGTAAYLRHMATVAQDELGIDPRTLGIRSISTGLGADSRATLEELWNAKVYDTYGTSEVGVVAGDGPDQSGQYIYEDAHVLEVVNPDTHKPMPNGEKGCVFVTSLFKELAPMIRFNTKDVSFIIPGKSPVGSTFRRMRGVLGRLDNMVKIKGMNVYPEAVGALIQEMPQSTGEYLCVVDEKDGQEELKVLVEMTSPERITSQEAQVISVRLKEALGVRVGVELVGPTALHEQTGVTTNASKAKRLIDNRKRGKE
jgi:phenylacetate-CoA ligase